MVHPVHSVSSRRGRPAPSTRASTVPVSLPAPPDDSAAVVRRRRKKSHARVAPPTGVIVELQRDDGSSLVLGDARTALSNKRLTAAERIAVENVVRAVDYLKSRFGHAGIDDAGTAVKFLVRSSAADSQGPFAQRGRITAGGRNPLASPGDTGRGASEILPYDVALHELAHVVQFARLGADWTKLQPQLAEGMADTLAMLATRDWTIGEAYFRRADGTSKRAIREIAPGATKHAGEPVVFDWRAVRDGRVEEHAAGAVLARTFYEIQQRLGWRRAEDLLYSLIMDAGAWAGGGTWQSIAGGIQAGAARLWATDAGALAAVEGALRVTHLDEALPR